MNQNTTSRRAVLQGAAVAASSGLLVPEWAQAQNAKIRVGLMLPYSGAFAPLGVAIENGVRLAINEQGGKLGGREIEWFKVDDESEPSKGIENANKLVQRDKVDVYDTERRLLRPLNYPKGAPGRGTGLYETQSGKSVLVINAMGRVFMNPPIENPFLALDAEVARLNEADKGVRKWQWRTIEEGDLFWKELASSPKSKIAVAV